MALGHSRSMTLSRRGGAADRSVVAPQAASDVAASSVLSLILNVAAPVDAGEVVLDESDVQLVDASEVERAPVTSESALPSAVAVARSTAGP